MKLSRISWIILNYISVQFIQPKDSYKFVYLIKLNTTAQPVLSSHPSELEKVVANSRWLLNAGNSKNASILGI